MATQVNIDGFNYAISSASGEARASQANTVVRAPANLGTATIYTPIHRPATFDGSSNDGVTNASIAVMDGLGYASNTSLVSGITHKRSLIDVTLGRPATLNDGDLHTKLSDRELLYGAILNIGPLTQDIHGRWFSATGAQVSMTSSGLGSWEIVAGTGDVAAYRGRQRAQEYSMRNGLLNSRIILPLRTA